MTYIQADADAAKAKIAADTAALATQTQAVTDAQTTLASAQAAETTAETQLTAAQDALASAQGAATDAASKLGAANAAVSATKADIATEQAIIDAFNAQPAPVHPTPTIIIAPPVISNPTIITQQQRLQDGHSYTFSNRSFAPGKPVSCPYVVKDGGHLGTIIIEDHDLTGGCGVIRLQNGIVDELIVRRCTLPQGHYDPGVIAGLVLVGHTYVKKITIEDCDYDRVEFITSAGDIYSGTLTGGGHGSTGIAYGQCDSFTLRNVRATNMWTAYTGTSAGKYPNSDGAVTEKLFQNGVYDHCEFRHGADAGIDRKSPNTTIIETILDDFRENDKIWCPANDVSIYSFNPRHAHCVVTPQPEYGRIGYHCQFRRFASSNPKTPLFDIQRAGWNAVYDTVDISALPAGQVLAICESTAFGSTVNLGGKSYTLNHGTVML